MITKANLLAAAGSIVMGPGGVVNFAAGCSVARTGPGTYNVLVDSQQTVPASIGGLFATMDAQPASQANLLDGAWIPFIEHMGDNYAGTAASPVASAGKQTLYTLVTAIDPTEPGLIFDYVGNLAFYVLAVGGGSPADPSATGM